MNDLKNEFSKEEIEILKTILLGRSTFYTREIVKTKGLLLKAPTDYSLDAFKSDLDYNSRLKKVVDKFYDFLDLMED